MKHIKHQYVKPGTVEFFVSIQGVKVILLVARFNDFNDIARLYKNAGEELATLNLAMLDKAAA